MKIDIIERTLKFAVNIIKIAKLLPQNSAIFVIANQIIKPGTSIGANT